MTILQHNTLDIEMFSHEGNRARKKRILFNCFIQLTFYIQHNSINEGIKG